MKKLLLILLTLCVNLGAMEESQSASYESNVGERQQLLDIFLPKGVTNTKAEDMTYNIDIQHECEPQSHDDNLWNLLPGEIKQHIFSFIPKLGCYDVLKNLILVNHEFNDLVCNPEFLRTFAYEIVKQNPAKSLDVYAWAMEHNKRSLAEYIFSAYFSYYIDPETNRLSKEWARLYMVIGMIEHNVKAARSIFCSAAAQGNEALVRLFISACSQTIYYTLASTSDQSERAKAISTLCRETGMSSSPDGRINVAPYECNPTPLHRAIAHHHKEIVQLLGSAGANIQYAYIPNSESIDDENLDHTAFSQAVCENDEGILRILLARSHTHWLQSSGGDFGKLLRHCFKNAVRSGKIEIVNLLLEEAKLTLDVNGYLTVHDSEQMTPLMIAASHGQNDMINHLLSIGADVNMKSKLKKETASELAEKNGHTQIATFLRSHERSDEGSCLIS